jgi:hypothetical protein
VAVSVLTIMITVGGICLGIGYATGNRRLKEFGRDELNQCVINGLLIGGLTALFLPSGLVTTVIDASVPANAAFHCPAYLGSNAAICFADGYLSGSGYSMGGASHASILSQSTGLMIGLLSLNTVLGLLSSMKISIDVASFSLQQVLSPVLSQIQFFIKALSTVSISVLVQSSILSAIAESATTIILPIGIILRTFYPTRQVGGFMLGVVIGLYVVFPLTYLLNASIINSYQISLSNSTITSLSSSANGLDSYVSSVHPNANDTGSIISGISPFLSSISEEVSGLVDTIMNYISYFIMAAFILPAFSVVITSISIRETASILGSETSFNLFEMI